MRGEETADFHYVATITSLGIGGTIRNVSSAGLLIDARMDLLDICQIFSEEREEDSPFELVWYLQTG